MIQCECGRAEIGKRFKAGQCVECWVRLNRGKWVGKNPTRKRSPCVSLGDVTGFVECAGCGGTKTRIKEFACRDERHAATTTWQECQQCPFYTAAVT